MANALQASGVNGHTGSCAYQSVVDNKVGNAHGHANSKRTEQRLGVALGRTQKSPIAPNRIVWYCIVFHCNKIIDI